jgi:HEAT repeat protein
MGGLCVLLALATAGCGLRTIPPIRYVPIFGKEREVTTTEVLVRALHDKDVSVRAEAVELLGLLATSPNDGLRKEVAAVLGWALTDSDPGLRLQAVEELGRMDQKFANRYLNRALKDPNPFVRGMVLRVLDAREKKRLNPAPVDAQVAAP